MALYRSDGLRISTYANGTPGTAGKGISNIENYYYATTTEVMSQIPDVGNSAWKTAISQLTEKPFNETNKYLQSTTGNISGIFDMSGGALEYVMGNYNEFIGNSGFGILPNIKNIMICIQVQYLQEMQVQI